MQQLLPPGVEGQRATSWLCRGPARWRTCCFLIKSHQALGKLPSTGFVLVPVGARGWVCRLRKQLQPGYRLGWAMWSPYSGLGRASLFLSLDLHAVLRVRAPGLFVARERQQPEGLPALGKDTSDQPALYRGWRHWTKASQSTAADSESKGYLKQV